MDIYLYDSTFTGLLTAIYHSFYAKKPPYKIYDIKDFQGDLISNIIKVQSDETLANKVEDAIKNKISKETLRQIYYLFLSNNIEKGMLIYDYLKLGFKVGPDLESMDYLDIVREVHKLAKRVTLEKHRFTGFVRFSMLKNGVLYSKIKPDHNILEILAPHFSKRFSNENWIIYDENRNLALVYNKISWEIFEVSDNIMLNIEEDEFAELWKDYFESVTIKERINPRLQKRMMPKRYWDNLTEL